MSARRQVTGGARGSAWEIHGHEEKLGGAMGNAFFVRPLLHLMSGKYPPLTDEFHCLSAALWGEHLTFVNFCISIPNETAFSKTDDLFQINLHTSWVVLCWQSIVEKRAKAHTFTGLFHTYITVSCTLVVLWIVGRRHDNDNKWAVGKVVAVRRWNKSWTYGQINTFPRCWTPHTRVKFIR